MNMRQLVCAVFAALLVLPLVANAEIYKWKDSEGRIRYSDTPPPSNAKVQTMGSKKAAKLTDKAPLSPVVDEKAKPLADAKSQAKGEATASAEEDAAKLRQKNAEAEKKNKEEKEKQASIKAENCKTAKNNLGNYKQGGRLFKTNEKGEREYIDDKDIKAGTEKAQRDVNENCN